MNKISQNQELLQHLVALLAAFRPAFRQTRVFQRAVLLLAGEVLAFARHTVTQLLMAVGMVDGDWSGWYRLFSRERFPYEELRGILLEETLKHVGAEDLYVVAGDATQTGRSSRKIEGVSYLPHPGTAVFARGLRWAQRWFHGAWLIPSEEGFSRAVPLFWEPAFTEKSKSKVTVPMKEWEAAVEFLEWLKKELKRLEREGQRILMVGDGHYDQLNLWKSLPEGVILLARSARNRALWEIPGAGDRKNRRYGERAPKPAEAWRERKGWKKMVIKVRGRERHLQVKVKGPYLRRGAFQVPLFLIVVKGKHRREPLAFLVNGVRGAEGKWEMPLGVEELLFWAWQRWEIEVTHRELKSNFGLGEKQCWNPKGAVRSVQWCAWVYATLVLVGYRTWGLVGGPEVPTRWWRGGQRWSLNSLWRAYRAAWWGGHVFYEVTLDELLSRGDLSWLQPGLSNAAFGAARI